MNVRSFLSHPTNSITIDEEIKQKIKSIIKCKKVVSLLMCMRYGIIEDKSPTLMALKKTSLHTLCIFKFTIFLV